MLNAASGAHAAALAERSRKLLETKETVAERRGFEPRKELPPCWFSRPVHSTALPSLHTDV